MAAVAVLDYSLFHHLFGVPETEALIGASGWMTKNDILGKQIAATAQNVGMQEQAPQNLSELIGLPKPYAEDDAFMVERMKSADDTMSFGKSVKRQPLYGKYNDQIKNIKLP